jgi:hypothetical protein
MFIVNRINEPLIHGGRVAKAGQNGDHLSIDLASAKVKLQEKQAVHQDFVRLSDAR